MNGAKTGPPAGEPRDLKVLGIAGSLRRGSFNRSLLRVARELAPRPLAIEILEIGDIPLYNGDLDNDEQRPASVRGLKKAVSEADGVLLVSPEYNHSVPGVLQNALDWASRPAARSPFRGKPVGMMGASASAIGTARGQQQLKLVMMSMLAIVMPHPGVVVTHAAKKFGDGGELADEPTREFVAAYLREFEEWVRRLTPAA